MQISLTICQRDLLLSNFFFSSCFLFPSGSIRTCHDDNFSSLKLYFEELQPRRTSLISKLFSSESRFLCYLSGLPKSCSILAEKITKKMLRSNDEVELVMVLLATFRLEYEDDHEHEFSIPSTRFRFGGPKFSKCACSELETRTRSRLRTPI